MQAYDLLIVGGGVQGLWLARFAAAAGLKTVLADRAACGAGASGGLLGALMAHVPTGWSAKKQFQFEALVELENLVGELEAECDIPTGYARAGRVMPIRTDRFKAQAEARRRASLEAWQATARRFELELLPPGACRDWIDGGQASLGVLWDPLAARIEPRAYIAALKMAVSAVCELREGWCFAGYDRTTGRALELNGGEPIAAGRIVLAAGAETFDIIKSLTDLSLGSGVKGQSVLVACELPAERPIIYDDGMYVVAHRDDQCAIGSTTETEWQDATSTDALITARLEHAKRLCPPLRQSRVIGAWAGIRPKPAARDPIVGRLPPDDPIYVATGGYKITFGIAHRIACKLIDAIVYDLDDCDVPETFNASRHVATARAKQLG